MCPFIDPESVNVERETDEIAIQFFGRYVVAQEVFQREEIFRAIIKRIPSVDPEQQTNLVIRKISKLLEQGLRREEVA
jgi:hypothetical protein